MLGLPRERIEPLPHYLPTELVAGRSRAAQGDYALVLARLSPEKGIDDAIAAAAAAGVPLRIAGDGPERARLGELAARTGTYHEFSPYSALEAMAQGCRWWPPPWAGCPSSWAPGRCVPPGDGNALAGRIAALRTDPRRREAEGEELIASVRANHDEEDYTRDLRRLYREVADHRSDPGKPALVLRDSHA